MAESQLDRVATWRKAHRDLLDLPGLSLLELALLMTLERRGMRDPTRLVAGVARPDVGWSVRRDERPDTRRELAAILRLPPGLAGVGELDAAIAGLVELGHVVVADDGAVGVVGWAETQESPDAARKRGERDPRRSGGGHSQDTARTEVGQAEDAGRNVRGHSGDDRPQRTEDRGQRTELVGGAPRAGAKPTLGQLLQRARLGGVVPTNEARLARQVGLDAATIRAFESDEQVPTRSELEAIGAALGDPDVARLELPEHDPGVVVFVVDLHRKLQVERGIVGPEHPPPRIDGEVARWVWAPGGAPAALLEEWRIVLRRAAEKIQREQERRGSSDSAAWFTLEHLARPKIRRGYLENHDLDKRSPPPRAAPARGRGGLRGPAPPQNDDDLPIG